MTTDPIRSRLRIDGMDCASCAMKIETALKRLPGVSEVGVSVTAGTATVLHGAEVTDAVLAAKVNALGYQARPETGAAPAAGAAEAACDCGHDHGDHHHDHDHDHGHDHAGHDHAHDHGHEHAAAAAPAERAWWQAPKARLAGAAALAYAVAAIAGFLLPEWRDVFFPLAMLVGLIPIGRKAGAAALNGTPFSIEMLMTVAALGALAIGAAEEAATVVVLFLIGELLEGYAAGRARASIRALADLVPRTARVEGPDGVSEVPAEEVPVGAVLVVRPGDRIAADGVVLSGLSAVDEAPVTGESVPKEKAPGSPVYAGTINTDAVLRVSVTAAHADNTIARIVRLVEEAQSARAPTERVIDRFARWYTPSVVVVAALVMVLPPLLLAAPWSVWIYRGLAILLIGCPCALVISTPAAIAAGLAAGARRGLLMKGGAVLEALGGITHAAFDKTGTLTEGRPEVTDVLPVAPFSRGDLLRLAAGLEAGSSHPLARAVLAAADAEGIRPPASEAVRAEPGRGLTGRVEGAALFLGALAPATAEARAPLDPALVTAAERLAGEGRTVAVLLADGVPAGLLAFADQPRADARSGLDTLRGLGIEPLMLTGDQVAPAESVGRTLGLAVHAALLPEDKQRLVRDLRAGGARVAKIGDGINDAPALAAADIGIAMGGGADVALETADAAILHGRVGDVAAMVQLSRRTMGIIHQNIAIALGLKAFFLVTTVLGITGLWPAILADTGATVLVTANALRLLADRRR
ncbi:heavy metal translocating P-type ATPase [Segnochrobactraceae bacterium EtOH-i3]